MSLTRLLFQFYVVTMFYSEIEIKYYYFDLIAIFIFIVYFQDVQKRNQRIIMQTTQGRKGREKEIVVNK